MATRAQIEAVMVKRCGPLMTKAGMAVTIAGSNDDLADPIAWGVRQCGYTTAVPSDVTSAEVAAVPVALLDKLLDMSQLSLLENISTNLDDVDTTVGPRSEKLFQLSQIVQSRLTRLLDKVRKEYGYGASAITAGVVTVQFAEHYTGSDE